MLLAAWPAAAAEPEPLLAAQPAIARDLAAFPRIMAPEGAVSQRINQALAQADARVRDAAKQCRADAVDAHTDTKDAGWHRHVTVAMRGAGYLALVTADDWYCGGAYPATDSFALAYDLRTSAPLNWARLLPKPFSGTASLDTAGDGTRLGVVASPALTALYLKLVKPDADCGSALRDTELHFMLWPDAGREGVAMAPSGLPHVIAACGSDAVIPLATLRTLGVDPALLNTIAAGHAAGLSAPPP